MLHCTALHCGLQHMGLTLLAGQLDGREGLGDTWRRQKPPGMSYHSAWPTVSVLAWFRLGLAVRVVVVSCQPKCRGEF